MIFLCGDVLNCQVLSDSMNTLWVAAQNAEIQYFFSDAPRSVLTARQGRQVRYGVRAARGLRHRYVGRGKWLRGCPDGHPLAGIRR